MLQERTAQALRLPGFAQLRRRFMAALLPRPPPPLPPPLLPPSAPKVRSSRTPRPCGELRVCSCAVFSKARQSNFVKARRTLPATPKPRSCACARRACVSRTRTCTAQTRARISTDIIEKSTQLAHMRHRRVHPVIGCLCARVCCASEQTLNGAQHIRLNVLSSNENMGHMRVAGFGWVGLFAMQHTHTRLQQHHGSVRAHLNCGWTARVCCCVWCAARVTHPQIWSVFLLEISHTHTHEHTHANTHPQHSTESRTLSAMREDYAYNSPG